MYNLYSQPASKSAEWHEQKYVNTIRALSFTFINIAQKISMSLSRSHMENFSRFGLPRKLFKHLLLLYGIRRRDVLTKSEKMDSRNVVLFYARNDVTNTADLFYELLYKILWNRQNPLHHFVFIFVMRIVPFHNKKKWLQWMCYYYLDRYSYTF